MEKLSTKEIQLLLLKLICNCNIHLNSPGGLVVIISLSISIIGQISGRIHLNFHMELSTLTNRESVENYTSLMNEKASFMTE